MKNTANLNKSGQCVLSDLHIFPSVPLILTSKNGLLFVIIGQLLCGTNELMAQDQK